MQFKSSPLQCRLNIYIHLCNNVVIFKFHIYPALLTNLLVICYGSISPCVHINTLVI